MTHHVIIVGAGLSGLSAAYQLSKHKNITVTVLETRDRIGGRTHTVHVNDVAMDVGGFIIYPWYRNFHTLIRELKLSRHLRRLPHVKILYKLSPEKDVLADDAIALSFVEQAKLAPKILSAYLSNQDVGRPNITKFRNKTVKEFFNLPTTPTSKIAQYIDTVCQGYGYPSIEDYHATFMIPMMGNNLLYGDITTASYFPKGMTKILEPLARHITRRGGEIRTETRVDDVQHGTVVTNHGTLHADSIILTHPLHKTIPFTRFLTVVISCVGEIQHIASQSWGSLFVHPDATIGLQILSIIHNELLYGKKAKQTLTLNIRLDSGDPLPTADHALAKRIKQSLKPYFPKLRSCRVVSFTPWEHMMPQSDEKTIQRLRNTQGNNGIFYAGDYLGCPSMETAIRTGCDAAEMVEKVVGCRL